MLVNIYKKTTLLTVFFSFKGKQSKNIHDPHIFLSNQLKTVLVKPFHGIFKYYLRDLVDAVVLLNYIKNKKYKIPD